MNTLKAIITEIRRYEIGNDSLLIDFIKELLREIDKLDTYATDDFCLTKDPRCEKVWVVIKKQDVTNLLKDILK